jgi:hypothetical protein
MTEHRIPYHAFSGEYPTERHPLSFSPLVQHHTDGTTSRDIIYLLPILESAGSAESPAPCLQQVHLPNGDPAFCCKKTEQHCACCGAAACTQHYSRGFLRFQDVAGCWQDAYDATLCETCVGFTAQMRTALHTFCRLLNAEGDSHV